MDSQDSHWRGAASPQSHAISASATITGLGLDDEVRRLSKYRKHLRWWIISCVVFLISAPILSIMLGLNLHTRDFEYKKKPSVSFEGRTLLMQARLISADPALGTLTLDWNILGEKGVGVCYRESGVEDPVVVAKRRNLTACTDVQIFFDTNLLRSNDHIASRSNDPPTRPIFRFNATSFALNDVRGNTPMFRTELALFSTLDKQSSLIYYPFDEYSAEIFMFAQDVETNQTVGVDLDKARGIAVGFSTNVEPRTDVFVPGGMLNVLISLRRANLVRAYSIVATLAIWLITLILLLVMLTSVFFGFRQKGEVLVIPVATLFAFTQLRQSMPGAPPGFGDIVDFVGLLPCLALLSLSAALTLGAFILSDPTETPKKLSWQLIYEAFPQLDRKKPRKVLDNIERSKK
ncbi:hypothetical protein CVT24_006597 [Panaeolus cyanescens]|uniref:Uncharacterized protein n=1 Tax=Panaeolus cyanescens TaxID=181874 RepID=A0A409WCG0_9AGAR|nr:hypothetical protein CVT24_006597 [Panaeolus cyanescens]